MPPRVLSATTLILALAAHASADPRPHATFDAKVASIEAGPHVLCGGIMATQPVKLEITKVSAGSLQPKTSTTIRVLTCFGGHLLRAIDKEPGIFELDPTKIRPGSEVHVEAEDLDRGAWFATVDKIQVTKY